MYLWSDSTGVGFSQPREELLWEGKGSLPSGESKPRPGSTAWVYRVGLDFSPHLPLCWLSLVGALRCEWHCRDSQCQGYKVVMPLSSVESHRDVAGLPPRPGVRKYIPPRWRAPKIERPSSKGNSGG